MFVVKKVSLLFFLIAVGSSCAMKRKIEPDNSNQQIVSYKSLYGFPLTSVHKGAQWFSSLSQRDKGAVTQNIINHKDKRLEGLFYCATTLPLDVQKVFAQHLYQDNEQVELFLNMPVAQAYCYDGFLAIINDKNNLLFKKICLQNPHCKPDIICSLAKEIAVFGDWTQRLRIKKKEEFEAVAQVVELFEDSFINTHVDIEYQYYEPFTLKKFITEDLRYLPVFLSAFITFALPWEQIFGVNEKTVKFNAIARSFNAEAVRAYEETGSDDFLDARVSLRDEYNYTFSPFAYVKMVSWLSVFVPLFDLWKLTKPGSDWDRRIDIKEMLGCLAIMTSFKVIEYIARRTAEQPFVGASCVTGLYLLARCLYNIAVKKRSCKYGSIPLYKLPALLKGNDIKKLWLSRW